MILDQSTAQDTGAIDGLISDMAKNGVKTSGQSFIGAGTSTSLKPFKPQIAGTTLEQQGNIALDKQNKLPVPLAVGAAVGTWAGNLAKDVGKNVYTSLSNAAIITGKFVQKEAFQLAHNGQDQIAFHGNNYSKLNDEYTQTSSLLSKQLKSGVIGLTEYNKQLADLDKNVGVPMRMELDKINSNSTQYQIRDWKTGNYRDVNPIGDAIDIANAAFTILTLGTGGEAKAVLADTLYSNFTKLMGRDMFITGLEKIGLKSTNDAITSLAGKIDTIVGDAITKIPGLREYVERQVLKLGGDLTAKKFVTNAIAETFLHAPLREMNIESAQKVVDSVRDGNFLSTPEGETFLSSGAGNALMLAGMALEGGPLGFLTKTFGKLGSAVKVSMFGSELASTTELFIKNITDPAVLEILQRGGTKIEGTFLDHIFRMSSKVGDAAEGWAWLSKQTPEVRAALKSVQESLSSGRVAGAAAVTSMQGIIGKLLAAGKEVNVENVMKDMLQWQRAGEIGVEVTPKLIARGIINAGDKVVPIKFARQDINKLIKAIDTIAKDTLTAFKEAGLKGKPELLKAQKQAIVEYIAKAEKEGVQWTQHADIMKHITDSIENGKTIGHVKGGIESIDAAKYVKGITGKLKKELLATGYVIGLPKLVTHPFVSIAEASGSKLASTLVGEVKGGMAQTFGLVNKAPVGELTKLLGDDVALVRGRSPAFGAIGKTLEKLGLSAQQSTAEAYKMVTTNAANAIDKLGVGEKGVNVLNALQNFTEKTKTLSDIRQMTNGEIVKALGDAGMKISKESAGKIQNAITKAHIDVPLALIGLADRATSVAQAIPYTGRLQSIYSRIQGALRYTFNPFFHLQEMTETNLLSTAATSGRSTHLSTFLGFGNRPSKEILTEIVAKMEKANMLDATMFGEGASNVALGRITANIGKIQKRELASVVNDLAEKYKMTVDTLLATRGQDVIDMIRPIVQYPTKGILNSNLAKAMNLAVFPARYNLKVTSLAVKAIANQTPAIQGAVIRGLWNYENWLKSDAGMAWQQDYANEIRFMKWITPVNSLEWTMKTLQGDRGSFMDLGQLGGLPFGVWGTILQDQGIIPRQSPYVDPKTGEIFSTKIPQSVKGRMAMAITDMIGSAFTFPGRTVGLPSKQQNLRDFVNRLVGTDKTDFGIVYRNPAELSLQDQELQKYWLERAKANGVTITKPVFKPSITLKDGVVVNSSSAPLLVKHSSSDILKAKHAQSLAKKTSGKKQPVDFNAIVNR